MGVVPNRNGTFLFLKFYIKGEKKMDQTKEETLSTLYALRAGLSVLSEIKDVADKHVQEVNSANARIKGIENVHNGSINEIRNDQEQKLKKVNDQIKGKRAQLLRVANDKQSKKENVDSGKKYINEKEGEIKVLQKQAKKYKIVFLVLLIFSIVSFLLGISFVNLGASVGDLEEPLRICGIVFMVSCFVVDVPVWIIFKSKYNKISNLLNSAKVDIDGSSQMESRKGRRYFLEEDKRALYNLENEYNGLRSDIERLEKEKKYLLSGEDSINKINVINARRDDEIKKEELKIAQATPKVIKQLEIFDAVYRPIQSTYNSFLDERDWQNVDLLIYYYETGRALDLRDALMQVDMDRRNERLVTAIAYATKEISRTIEDGFRELASVIEDAFDRLNRTIRLSVERVNDSLVKLGAQTEATNKKLSDISKQNEIVNERLGRISEVADAQEALLRKMTTSSDVMASDINYMRELAHNTYYKR